MANIIHVTAVTGNYDNGQKLDKALVEYDCPLAGTICPDSYSVSGRTITNIEVSGNTVCLHLDVKDELARIVAEPKPQHKPGEKPGGKHFGGPPVNMPPASRRPVQVSVSQIKAIAAADGSMIPADGGVHISDRTWEPVVEDFTQDVFQGIPYNLFTPKQLEPGKQYPLVLFIHDAGPCGPDPKLTLSQGLGAVSFADPGWQENHPCFVLAPQINRGIPMTTDDFTCSKELEIIKSLLDSVVDSHPVDRARIYATGQSMGCMASCELNIRYPELFAASLLVAGQWDPERMGQRCSGKRMWILVSEQDAKAFPGMNAVTEAMERKGAVVARHRWDGSATPEALSKQARIDAKVPGNVHYTVFNGSSVVPAGVDPNPGANHINTWRVVYTIEGLKNWLFA